jgi:hypothetical protein
MQSGPQEVQFTVSDPNQVPEILINGPTNLNVGPEVTILTFTNVRPDIDKLMHGRPDTKQNAVVVAKLVIPTSGLIQLHAMLGQALANLSFNPLTGARPESGTVPPSGKSH